MATNTKLLKHIEQATDHDQIRPTLAHIELDALKKFVADQVCRMSAEEQRTAMYSTLSMNELLPSDTIQHMLAFTDFSPFIGGNIDRCCRHVCKQWKSLCQTIEMCTLRSRYHKLDAQYRVFRPNRGNTWIWDGVRTDLHAVEINEGVHDILHRPSDFRHCKSGDTILIRNNWSVNQMNLDHCSALRIIGFDDTKPNHRAQMHFTEPSTINVSYEILNCNVFFTAHCIIGGSGHTECTMQFRECQIYFRSDAYFKVWSSSSLHIDNCSIQSISPFTPHDPTEEDLVESRALGRVAILTSTQAKHITMTSSAIKDFRYGVMIRRNKSDCTTEPFVELNIRNNTFCNLTRYAIIYRCDKKSPSSDLITGDWRSNKCVHENCSDVDSGNDDDDKEDKKSCGCQPNTMIIKTSHQ